ncbi:MAG: sulfatase [Opitutales bacterium]
MRLSFLLTLSAAILTPPMHAKDHPNVLMISVDDMNDFASYMGLYPDVITPNMDRLAASGTAFNKAHCQYPLCSPSRASVMSGLFPYTSGIIKNTKDDGVAKIVNDLGAELMHTYFSKHGYKTMAIGKIMHRHLPRDSADLSGGRKEFNHGTGNLKAQWPQKGTSTDWAIAPDRDEDLADHQTATWAVERLQEQHDEPFMLMVGFLRPHVPWYAPKKWFDLYDRDAIKLPRFEPDDMEDVPAISRKVNRSKHMPSTEWAIKNGKYRDIVHAYLACISFVDHQVGRVLEALESSPYKDNTIIVFWSDHGYHIGEKNTFQKITTYERSSHVPFVFAGPGVPAGQHTDRVVSLLDMYPTLVELTGLPKNERNEGRSLVPLMDRPTLDWPHPSIIQLGKGHFAIQSERYRYIRYEDGSEELYDHKTDLDEIHNIAGNPEYDSLKTAMAKYIPGSDGVNKQ